MQQHAYHNFFLTALLILFSLVCGTATATEKSEIGIVVLHGKWDSQSGHASGLANYLSREGFQVSSPEMPWSGRRAYDKGTDDMVAEIDKAADDLKKAGAKKIYVAGHSQGAVGSLYFATRQQVSGLILIAAGGHSQGKRFVTNYAPSVAEAKKHIERGKAGDNVSFTDLNTGGRTKTIKSPAQSVVDYFDPEGPFNSYLTAPKIMSGTAVLIIIPKDEVDALKDTARTIGEKLPVGTQSQIVEVGSDHLNAPDASKAVIRDWLLTQ